MENRSSNWLDRSNMHDKIRDKQATLLRTLQAKDAKVLVLVPCRITTELGPSSRLGRTWYLQGELSEAQRREIRNKVGPWHDMNIERLCTFLDAPNITGFNISRKLVAAVLSVVAGR
jgi:hypothetical protein